MNTFEGWIVNRAKVTRTGSNDSSKSRAREEETAGFTGIAQQLSIVYSSELGK